jgi:hypothetical protein
MNDTAYNAHIHSLLEPDQRIISGSAKRYPEIQPRPPRTERDDENEAYLRRTEAEANRREDEWLKGKGVNF